MIFVCPSVFIEVRISKSNFFKHLIGFIEKLFDIFPSIINTEVKLKFKYSAECSSDWVKTNLVCYNILPEQSTLEEAVSKCKEPLQS